MAAARTATAVQTASDPAHTRAERSSAGRRSTAGIIARRGPFPAEDPRGAFRGRRLVTPPDRLVPAIRASSPPRWRPAARSLASRTGGDALGHPLLARKPLPLLLEEPRGETRLRRALGPPQLPSRGGAAVIG